MWLYLIIFLIPVFFYMYREVRNGGQLVFLVMYITFLAFFVGLSDMLGGYDRYIYGDVFDTIADTTTIHGSYHANGDFEFFPEESGYTWLNILISFFTENRYIFILIITLLIYSLLFISIKRFSNNYALAMILFMGLWFYFSFTYLRQVVGAVVIWLSIKYVLDRKLWKFLLVVFIGMSIHKSAIIFLPFYFIPIKKFEEKDIKIFMVAMLLLGLSPIPNALFSAYGDMSAVEMQADYSASGGLRIAYVLEAFFFLFFILERYKYVPNKPRNIVMLNLALLFCATLLFFARSTNGGRLSWYYMLGVIITISNLSTVGPNKRELSIVLIVLCLFLNIRIYNSWQIGMQLYPYKTFLSNGFRKGDPIQYKYEYDDHYQTNKLYRKPFRLVINPKY